MIRLLKATFPVLYFKLMGIRRYMKCFGRLPNLIYPSRFTDKLLVARLRYNGKDDFLSMTADKWAVRDYVKLRVGGGHLSEVQMATENMSSVDFDDLIYPVVLKSTHGTAHVEILWSRQSFDEDRVRRLCEGWLLERFPLWYSQIPPRIMFEEFLSVDDGSRSIPYNYNFFVFSGTVRFIVVDIDRFEDHRRSLFTRDWAHLDVTYKYPKGPKLLPPKNLEIMVQMAEKLSDEREFIRIDLYDLGTRVVFGEVTHSPDASCVILDPDEFDFEVGQMWEDGRNE
ncbi:hypothetical protein OAA45_01015 [bacterium]|nr:hypothetical protein [bacterium]